MSHDLKERLKRMRLIALHGDTGMAMKVMDNQQYLLNRCFEMLGRYDQLRGTQVNDAKMAQLLSDLEPWVETKIETNGPTSEASGATRRGDGTAEDKRTSKTGAVDIKDMSLDQAIYWTRTGSLAHCILNWEKTAGPITPKELEEAQHVLSLRAIGERRAAEDKRTSETQETETPERRWPKWTLLANLTVRGPWLGKGWWFFDTKEEAVAFRAHLKNSTVGTIVATLRPFYRKTDRHHMGGCQGMTWAAKKTPMDTVLVTSAAGEMDVGGSVDCENCSGCGGVFANQMDQHLSRCKQCSGTGRRPAEDKRASRGTSSKKIVRVPRLTREQLNRIHAAAMGTCSGRMSSRPPKYDPTKEEE